MRILFPVMLIILICFSCGEKDNSSEGSKTQKISEKDSVERILVSQTSKRKSSWPGIYSGVLPCEDCPGIDATITLYEDSTFQQKMRYIDSTEKDTTITGKFSWKEKGDKIKLEGVKTFSEYKIEELYLLPLEGDGEEIKPIPGNNFHLLKE